MIRFLSLPLIAGLCLTASLAGASPMELSVERALDLAREHSQDLKLRDNDIERVEAQKRSALGSALPQISAEVTWQNYPTPPTMNGIPLKKDYETVGTITVRQALFTFGAVSNALAAADAGLNAGRLAKEATWLEIAHATRLTYASALLAAQQLEIAQESLKNAEENLRIMRQAVSGGRPGQSDFVRLQADVNSRRPRVQEAQANFDQALMNLRRLTGLPPEQELRLTTPTPERFPALNKNLLRDKLNAQPQLGALEQTIEVNDRLAKTRRSRRWPSIGAFYSHSRSHQSDTASPGAGPGTNTAALGVGVSWNIWDGGSTDADYRQALTEKSQAEIQLRKTREDFELALSRAISSYEAQRESQPSYVKAVDLARESFRISQQRFRAGQTSVTELNDVDGLLTQTRLQRALNAFQLSQSLSEIERLSGVAPEAR